MTKITIVDENDNAIGDRERFQLIPGDIYRVSALWLTNSRGDILMAQRSFAKKNSPGKWSAAVAGTVESDENYNTNIVKEIEEEIGLSLSIKDLIKGPKIFIKGMHNDFFAQWYFYTIDKPAEEFKIQPDEVRQVEWFSRDGLMEAFNTRPHDFVQSTPQWIKFICK